GVDHGTSAQGLWTTRPTGGLGFLPPEREPTQPTLAALLALPAPDPTDGAPDPEPAPEPLSDEPVPDDPDDPDEPDDPDDPDLTAGDADFPELSDEPLLTVEDFLSLRESVR
ncbi:MAG: hypothetical protein WAR57_02630, partial [Candidatus Phosphoribacter sp.]